jgi:hypothetical protein
MNTSIKISMLAMTLAFAATACSSSSGDESNKPPTKEGLPAGFDPSETYTVDIDAADLTSSITNPMFPAPVGAKWVYEAKFDDGVEHTEVVVQPETKTVWGATARVVRDSVSKNGAMVEDTFDWYAQDDDGHVWYLGEDSTAYENGVVKCQCGSWAAGTKDALPGVVMLAEPTTGHTYRQEFLAGEAEDIAQVVSLDETVTVPAGTFSGCIKTRDRSAIDSSADESKYYCPGVGLVLEEEGDERVELIEYSGL